ncbi:SurA N-terminal domain-containing protein [Radiobacillus sp. PE A8.2]|uniref:SurA N-terminal domain-containing protein n=1 Tax=Radiobacillus sp. PE A8.2 TaxID=3380349 RepID=UPI0038905438
MKKFAIVITLLLTTLFVAACNSDNENEQTTADGENGEANQEQTTTPETTPEPEEYQVEEDEVVAIVNGEEILGAQFNEVSTQIVQSMAQNGQDTSDTETVKQYTVDSVVGQTLIMQEAEKQDITVSDEDIENSLEVIRSQYENEEAFTEALESNKYTLESLKEDIEDDLYVQNYLDQVLPNSEVTDEDAQTYYDEVASQNDELPAFEEVKETIKQMLSEQKQNEETNKLIEELRGNSDIEVLI